jgi:uncharacterized membrane protein
LNAAAGLGAVAAALIGCARLADGASEERRVLGGLAACALVYLAPFGLSGAALTAVWAAGALALLGVWRVTRDPVARALGALPASLAVLHVLVYDAPPRALVDGAGAVGLALLAVGAVAAALLAAARMAGDEPPVLRTTLEIAGAAFAVYGISVGVVSAFPPDAATVDPALTGLGVRQQGQMLLSAFWAGTGLVTLVWGLVRDERSRRAAGLALLSLALGKVFVYDLAALDSIYRVVSFVALGVLLLIGAFAYQRMRPTAEAH